MLSFKGLLMRSTLLALLFTVPPVILLIVLRLLELINPLSIIGWGIFTLCWTALATYLATKLYEKKHTG